MHFFFQDDPLGPFNDDELEKEFPKNQVYNSRSSEEVVVANAVVKVPTKNQLWRVFSHVGALSP
jgi:hypothetical protein